MSGKAGLALGGETHHNAGTAEQGASAGEAEGDTGGRNFTDSVPMDRFRADR